MTEKPRRPGKMKPHTRAWSQLAFEVALGYCPPIYPCADCGGPVIKGYCCQRCGSDEPETGTKPSKAA